MGLEPIAKAYETLMFACYNTVRIEWSKWDLNPHPPRCKQGAQPIELLPHINNGALNRI